MKELIISLLLLSVNVACAKPTTISVPDTTVDNHTLSVFMGGSLFTPWRNRFTALVSETDLVLLDPSHPPVSGRIEWEQTHIEKADCLLMWIAKNTPRDPYSLSLTSLFELGRFAQMSDKPLFLGIEEGYALREELVYQMRALRSGLVIYDSIDSLAAAVKTQWRSSQKPERVAALPHQEPVALQSRVLPATSQPF